MTVPNTISGVVRIGDGVVTVFSFPFQVTSVEQVLVADIGNEQQVVDRPDSEYTVSVNPGGAGGEVTFTAPVADEQKIYIYRATEQTQLVSVSSQQRYDPKVTMAVWDRLTFMIQELNAKTERAVLAAPDTNPQELFTDVLLAQQLATLAADEAANSEDAAAISALAAMASQVAAAASAISAAADAAIASAAVDAVSEASWSSVDAYGAVGDGVHDDRPAFIAALNAAAGRKLIGRAGAVYRISDNIEYIGSVSLDLSMAGWFCDTPNIQPFTFRDPGVSDVALLTSDYVDGTLELAISGLPYAPKAGSRIHIVSNARDPGNRDEGSSAAQYRVGEDAIVGEGSTTTLIRLATPLRFLRGIHPTSSSGDEADVAPYTVAMYARIVALKDEAFCRVKLGRGMFAGGHGDDTSPIWRAGAISVYGYRSPEISGEFILGYGPAITVVGTYGAKIVSPVFMCLEDDTAQGQYGYGVLDKGWATQVHGMISHNVRHAYTTGADARAANGINNWSILSIGRIVGALVQGCHATGGVAAPYDTHACAEDVTFVDCSAEGVGAAPFALRGRNIHLVRPKVRSSSGGVLAFTEYDNNDPDDDIYNNGKTVADFTSVVVDSPDIECTGDAIVANAASVEMVGRGRIRSTSHRFIALNGGALTVYNHQSLVAVGGAAPNATACITATPAAAAALGAFPTSIITLNRGAALDIDARDSTSTLPDLISAASGTKVMVEGLLRARMPNIIGMALARVECPGPGVIEYSLANSVTIADLALIGLPVRMLDITTGERFDGTGDTAFYSGYAKTALVTNNGVFANGLLLAPAPFENRAAAEDALIPMVHQTIGYYGPGGSILYFVRDASGTALTTAGGATWSPVGDATPEHWADAPIYSQLNAAMQWAIDNSRKFVARGSYSLADGFTLLMRGDLLFDLRGAVFTAEKNTYQTTRLDMIRVQSGGDGSADWTLDWDGGKFDGTWIPFPGSGESRYLINISTNAAAFVRRVKVEGLIAGKTFMHKPVDDIGRVCGGESGIFYASPKGHIEIQRAIGFKDAVLYISSPSGLSSGRYGMVTYDVRAEYCRHCVTAKRGFYQFSGRLQAYQCREGVGFSQATMEGPYQSGWGGIHFVDARCCEWAVCDREGQKATYHFNSIDIGVMFGESSPGAGDGFKSTEACGIRFLGSTDLTSYGSVHGVNPDIVADGYTLGNFRAVVFKDSGSGKSATNNTVHLTASNVDRLVVDLESGDGTPDPDRNLIVHRSHDIALGSVILGANTILTTHRRWSDLGSITADTLTLNTALTGAAVMASKTDQTPGLVMTNGAHGLAILRDVNDTHDVKTIAPGFVGNSSASSVPAGVPVSGAYRWVGQKHEKDSNTASLIWHQPDGNMLYIQSNSGGVWSDWSRLYGWNNVVGPVSLSGGVPTGRLIEYGSNANGRYVRLADGTQICWQTATANIAISTGFLGGFRSTGQGWTFPAEFSAAPALSGSSPDQTSLPPIFGTTGATSTNWNAVAFTSQSAADRTVTILAIGRWA